MRVHLLRQVTFVLKGLLSTRQFSIGEGNLRSLPPGASPPSLLRSQSLVPESSTLDYEGQVQPNADITAGQFALSRLQVRVRGSPATACVIDWRSANRISRDVL